MRGALEQQETGHAEGQLGYELSQLNMEQRRERQEKIKVYTNEPMELCPQHIKTCWPCFTVTYSNISTLVSIMAQLVHYVARTHTHCTHTVHRERERVSRGVCHNVLFSHLHTEDAGALIIAQGVTDRLS